MCRCSTYRTGPYAGSGIPIANGMHDYLTMLNERDGGIGGVKIVFEECETGYDTQKGVECYEAPRRKRSLVYNPYSTGITLQLIPKAVGRQDPDPLHGLWPLGRGRSARPSPGSSTRPIPIGTAPRRIIKHIGRAGRRPRQAQGQEDRLHLSRCRLRQRADPALRAAGHEIRLRAAQVPGARQGDAEPVARNGSTSAATSRTTW